MQISSEKHNVNAITQWNRTCSPVPKEVVSDFSLAILVAPLTSETCKKYLKAEIAEAFFTIPVEKGEEQEQLDACDQNPDECPTVVNRNM